MMSRSPRMPTQKRLYGMMMAQVTISPISLLREREMDMTTAAKVMGEQEAGVHATTTRKASQGVARAGGLKRSAPPKKPWLTFKLYSSKQVAWSISHSGCSNRPRTATNNWTHVANRQGRATVLNECWGRTRQLVCLLGRTLVSLDNNGARGSTNRTSMLDAASSSLTVG